jgi:hypothetical protein
MTILHVCLEGIGFWAPGLPSWEHARAFANGAGLVEGAPSRPSPQLLAANERRRAPETVAVALEVGLAACTAAGRDPARLPSVFASTHGDLGITDYICSTLATAPRTVSPTRFHNSVHNAAAGYWTIGTGAMQPATALSALNATFAQGLLDALAQLATGDDAVLLVGYDGAGVGPLGEISRSNGLLGGALLLSRGERPGCPRLSIELRDGVAAAATGALSRHAADNAMAPMLPLFDALATQGHAATTLDAGAGRVLAVTVRHPDGAPADD